MERFDQDPPEVKLRESCTTFHSALPLPKYLTVNDAGPWCRPNLHDTVDLAQDLFYAHNGDCQIFVPEIRLEAKEYTGGSMVTTPKGILRSSANSQLFHWYASVMCLNIIGKGIGKTILNGSARIDDEGSELGTVTVENVTWTNCSNGTFDDDYYMEYPDQAMESVWVGGGGIFHAQSCDFVGSDVAAIYVATHGIIDLKQCQVGGNSVRERTKNEFSSPTPFAMLKQMNGIGIELDGGKGKLTDCTFRLGGSIFVNDNGTLDLHGAATSADVLSFEDYHEAKLGYLLHTRNGGTINIHLPREHHNNGHPLDTCNADRLFLQPQHIDLLTVAEDVVGEINIIPLTPTEQTTFDAEMVILRAKEQQRLLLRESHQVSGFYCVPEDYDTLQDAMEMANNQNQLDLSVPFEIRLSEGLFVSLFPNHRSGIILDTLRCSRTDLKISGSGEDKTFVRGGFIVKSRPNLAACIELQNMTIINPGGMGLHIYPSDPTGVHAKNVVEHVTFKRSAAGLYVERNLVKANNCHFVDNCRGGVELSMQSQGFFTDCVVSKNKVGYQLEEDSSLDIFGTGTDISLNTAYGIRSLESKSHVVIHVQREVIHDNGPYGDALQSCWSSSKLGNYSARAGATIILLKSEFSTTVREILELRLPRSTDTNPDLALPMTIDDIVALCTGIDFREWRENRDWNYRYLLGYGEGNGSKTQSKVAIVKAVVHIMCDKGTLQSDHRTFEHFSFVRLE